MNKIKNITLGDKQFKPFIESDKIISKIINMSITLNKDYTNKKPLFRPSAGPSSLPILIKSLFLYLSKIE